MMCDETLAALILVSLSVERNARCLRRSSRIAFMLLDGRHFMLDTSKRPMLREDAGVHADAQVLCNKEGLLGVLRGHDDDGVLICRGDRDAFDAIAEPLRSDDRMRAR